MSIFHRLIDYIPPTAPSKPHEDETISPFAKYLGRGIALPYALLCGVMAIAGMFLLTGIPGLAIAAGSITFFVNLVRFSEYAPSLISKLPKAFKEVNEHEKRTHKNIKSKDRLFLVTVFVFFFSIVAAVAATFFSLLRMNQGFAIVGLSNLITLGGFSIIPALVLFGAVSLFCYWAMFASDASHIFAQNTFWKRFNSARKQVFWKAPDRSLLLPHETFDSVGSWMIVRKLIRAVLVIGIFGLMIFGNYIVAQMGIDSMLTMFGVAASTPMALSDIILPAFAILGGSVFTCLAVTKLSTILVLGFQFTWNQYMSPVDMFITKRGDNHALSKRFVIALICSPALLPILALRTLAGFIEIQWRFLKETIKSSDTSPQYSSMKDMDSFFLSNRLNTYSPVVNGLVNTFAVLPLTVLAGVVIFLKHNYKLIALLNAINTGANNIDPQASQATNALAITGGFVGSTSFGLAFEKYPGLTHESPHSPTPIKLYRPTQSKEVLLLDPSPLVENTL